jgi:hypothetical protein
MSSKNTWLWLTAAAVLFAFIFLFERFRPHPDTGPAYLLPGLNAKAINTVQIRMGQVDIRVERTNGVWQLVQPVIYPAQNTNVQNLLDALQQLLIAHQISEKEFRADPKAGENFGIDPAQLSLILDSRPPIYFGYRTSPGDQVFVQVPGIEGVAVVDADVLKLFPRDANDWRDTTLAGLKPGTFDRISVTNTIKSQWSFVLQRDSTNKLWAMISPLKVRADSEKVEDAMRRLEKLRVRQFVSDDPKADLESYGLQPPALTLALGEGTNLLLALDFGKELTNSPGLIYARRRDQNTVVTISTNTLALWNTSYDVFRDRHLVTLLGPIESIHIAGEDEFTMQWETNTTWRILSQDFPVDQTLATRLARNLSELQVADFEHDSVMTKTDLAKYGLATPERKIILAWAASPTATNQPTELDFGTNSNNQIFAQRLGEEAHAVYGIAPADFEALPSASWQLRDRLIWNFDINDVTQITIRQNGKTLQIVHTNGWSLATNSSGVIKIAAIEDTTRELGHLTAFSWYGHGAAKLADFGITPESYRLTIELKKGEKLEVQFGKATALGSVYASVMLNGEPWIFEFPPDLYPRVQYCLMIPAS